MAETPATLEHRHPPVGLLRLINPPVRWLAGTRAGPRGLLLLHLTGRRSGRPLTVPVGYQLLDGVPLVVTDRPWRLNCSGGRDIEVTERGVRRPVRAVLVDDPAGVADLCERLAVEQGWRTTSRRLGLRGTGDRPPTRAEVEDLVRRTGLSLLRLEPRTAN